MNVNDTDAKEPVEQHETTTVAIDATHHRRALTEQMTVRHTAPGLATVETDGGLYELDFERGTCDCPDHRYRDTVCKHLINAAVHLTHTIGVRTRWLSLAGVAIREQGCPHRNVSITHEHDCEGPLASGVYPCDECARAVGTDDWSVWRFIMTRERLADVKRGQSALATEVDATREVATDGGISRPSCAVDGCDRNATELLSALVNGVKVELYVCEKHHDELDGDGSPSEDGGAGPDAETDGGTIVNDHGDCVPAQTERPDFGGGSSTGVKDL